MPQGFILPTCHGSQHVWVWPKDINPGDEPPPDWPCTCGLLYPDGAPVTYEDMLPRAKKQDMPSTLNMTGKCPRCNAWIDDHPTRHCDWNWT